MIIDNIDFVKSIEKYRDDKIVILGHDTVDVDSIVSGFLLEKYLVKNGFKATFYILDKKISVESLNMCLKYGLDARDYQKTLSDEENLKYILLDHNQRDVKGEIIAIIDHHPTTCDIKTKLYFNKIISSTACYITMNNEHCFNEKELKLALLATVLDTASFHSDKGKQEDEEWVLKYCKKTNINYEDLYKDGLCLTSLDDIDKACLNGLKSYNYGDKKVESSYIQVENTKENNEKVVKAIEKLKVYVEKEKLNLFVYIVHDMTNFKTKIYKITNEAVIEKNYNSYTSRGTTIMPEIEKELIS